MSQINLNNPSLSHYESNLLEKPKAQENTNEVLLKAEPLPKSSSAWKLGGRIAVGILTVGVSELLRLSLIHI